MPFLHFICGNGESISMCFKPFGCARCRKRERESKENKSAKWGRQREKDTKAIHTALAHTYLRKPYLDFGKSTIYYTRIPINCL